MPDRRAGAPSATAGGRSCARARAAPRRDRWAVHLWFDWDSDIPGVALPVGSRSWACSRRARGGPRDRAGRRAPAEERARRGARVPRRRRCSWRGSRSSAMLPSLADGHYEDAQEAVAAGDYGGRGREGAEDREAAQPAGGGAGAVARHEAQKRSRSRRVGSCSARRSSASRTTRRSGCAPTCSRCRGGQPRDGRRPAHARARPAGADRPLLLTQRRGRPVGDHHRHAAREVVTAAPGDRSAGAGRAPADRPRAARLLWRHDGLPEIEETRESSRARGQGPPRAPSRARSSRARRRARCGGPRRGSGACSASNALAADLGERLHEVDDARLHARADVEGAASRPSPRPRGSRETTSPT